jgi:hypothetical protein
MPLVFLSEEISNIERPAFPCVEGANPFVDLGAEVAQLFDMGQQPTANLLLIRVGEIGDFCDR